MDNKPINKTIVYVFVATSLLSMSFLSANTKAYAFLGFNLFGEEEEEESSSTTTQTSTSLQNARCHSPTGSIMNSCNSSNPVARENTGVNSLGQ